MTLQKFYNPQSAGTISLGQSQEQEAKLIADINGNGWFIWGWAALNVGAAFISPLVMDGDVGAALFGAVFAALIFGIPTFLLCRNQGFYSACMLFALAIINAISGVFMAASGEVRLNFGTAIVAMSIIGLTAFIVIDAYKLRRFRNAKSN